MYTDFARYYNERKNPFSYEYVMVITDHSYTLEKDLVDNNAWMDYCAMMLNMSV